MKKDPNHSPFYSLEEFPYLQKITDNFEVIREELGNIMGWISFADSDDQLDPVTKKWKYIQGDWDISPIIVKRKFVGPKELMVSPHLRFPKTYPLLDSIPQINAAGFLRLTPGSVLEAHTHDLSVELIYHLGIVIPPGETCGLRAGDEIYTWKKAGDALIFDGNYEHEAWNESTDCDRILLYVNFDAFNA